MPVWPGTAMTNGGRTGPLPPPRPRGTDDADIVALAESLLGAPAHILPPMGKVSSATVLLRRHIRTASDAVRVAAAELLPRDDPRRVAAEKAVDEGLHRVERVGPGDGLRSAFGYARSLAQSARELRGHLQKLALIAEAERGKKR
ncbi:hypothetical protein I5Q34_03935 [Streptomyces sp. AV19]|uniref:DUF6415 family natural product biosynthesis protein n=1 Tax=Streptomyces sp. AV19 TaxID=2793068 RepID=UPI0018FEEFD7|nr:DUF6415 family natural product biosynthesis protein [Streptomyces sp. AV19]MBH1933444.1 hypothetical protein [Streptomyces sp. AV19]MDG4532093.1 DUF6415 family natural product biosynthesis protein [Streptomyces sp. AV19]